MRQQINRQHKDAGDTNQLEGIKLAMARLIQPRTPIGWRDFA